MRPKSNTCILIAANNSGKLFMAGDRRISWDFSQAQTIPYAKVIKQGKLLLGGTGDGALCDLFTRVVTFPTPKKDQDAFEYISYDLYNMMWEVLFQRGFIDAVSKTLHIPGTISAEIVVGLNKRLFSIDIGNPDPDNESRSGLITATEIGVPYATGCGGQWAWAGYEALTNNTTMPIEKRMRAAMRIAAKHSPGCDDKIDIINEV